MKTILWALAASLAVTASAHAQDPATSAAPAATTVSAAISIVTASETIGAPAAGKGQIIFFRPSRLGGAALGCTVRENNEQIGRLGNGKYFVHAADPGTHVFTVSSEATDTLTLEIEPDETYFVRCNIGMGIVAGRPNISPAERSLFEERASRMRRWTPAD